MNEPTFICPKCKSDIKLSPSRLAPFIEPMRRKLEQAIAQKQADVAKREAVIRDHHEVLENVQRSIDEQVEVKLKDERKKIAVEEAGKVRQALALDLDQKGQELAELRQVLADRDIRLGEAQNAHAELIRKRRELDDAKREVELTIERRVQDSLTTIRDQARQEAEDDLKLKVAEREETIHAMRRQLEELRQRAGQGSQQLQGEVLELELEGLLRARFPRDIIGPVPKGLNLPRKSGQERGRVIERITDERGRTTKTKQAKI